MEITRGELTAYFLLEGDIMDGGIMESLIQLIQGVGFPIACAVAMFIMLNKEQKEHKEESIQLNNTITAMKESITESMNNQKSDMVSALNNNTLVLQKLLDKLDDVHD